MDAGGTGWLPATAPSNSTGTLSVLVPARSADGKPAILSVYVCGGDNPGASLGPLLLFAAFDDGTTIRLQAAGQYAAGQISADEQSALFEHVAPLISQTGGNNSHRLPDAPWMAITFMTPAHPSTVSYLESFHEVVGGANSVATQDGLVALENTTPEAVQAHWSPQYRVFRQNWDAIRKAVDAVSVRDSTIVADPQIKYVLMPAAAAGGPRETP